MRNVYLRHLGKVCQRGITAVRAITTAVLGVLTLLALNACSQQSVMQKFASQEDQAAATKVIDSLRGGRFEEIEKRIDPSLSSSGLHDTLVQMAALIPKKDPTSVTLVGARTMHGPDGTTKNLTFEYDFAGKWLLINVATLERSGTSTIVGLHVSPQSASLEEQNRFRLSGKTTIQYGVLTLAVIFALFSLYVLVVCVRTTLSGPKWPWVLAILFGVGKLSVNWTTGEWGFTSLAVQLFSGSAVAQLYGPWIVSISFPLGAVIFLYRRKSLAASVPVPSSIAVQ